MQKRLSSEAQFRPASDQSLLISLGEKITLESHERVLKLLRLLQEEPLEDVRNLHPAYCSLLVKFDPLRTDHAELQSKLLPYIARIGNTRLPTPRQVKIPVCYGEEFGPDLQDVAARHGMTAKQLIDLHSVPVYIVYFLGFAPGFAYLGGLPERLATPRLETPRPRVPAGAVGIGGHQTGVYPLATPGGWRLIWRTPLAMFQRDRKPMSRLQIGDRVRFQPISEAEFSEFGNT
jgi:inhibitor of KinA